MKKLFLAFALFVASPAWALFIHQTTVPARTTSAPVIGATVTTVSVINTIASSQSNVPITFGQVFKQGDFNSTSNSLIGDLGGGVTVPLQVDVKALHGDGSVRHAIISAVIPSMTASQTLTLTLKKTNPVTNSSSTPAALLSAGFTGKVDVTYGGTTWTASANSLLGGSAPNWLGGSVVNEWEVSDTLRQSGVPSNQNLNLTARFSVRYFPGSSKAKVDVIVENDTVKWGGTSFAPAPQSITYDATITIGGVGVYTVTGLKHYPNARWKKTFWWNGTPSVDVKPNMAYLMSTFAVPNYDTSVTPTSAISSLNSLWSTRSTTLNTAISGAQSSTSDSNYATGPLGVGMVSPYMPDTGGRLEIAPFPEWVATYLLSGDTNIKNITLNSGDLAGSWPIHYRDSATDAPVSISTYPYASSPYNGAGASGACGSNCIDPVTAYNYSLPACAGGGDCTNVFYADTAHQASFAYLPYILTGDYYYLEELQFFANWNMLRATPAYRGFNQGLAIWDQVRGQAWSLRTLGQAAYITPDSGLGSGTKTYFNTMLANNLTWYNTYATANPSQLGILGDLTEASFSFNAHTYGPYAFNLGAVYATPVAQNGSAAATTAGTGIAPWQDDFFTWSIGSLADMKFSGASTLLSYKAGFPVLRMTDSNLCWVDGSRYYLTVRNTSGSAYYSTTSALSTGNYSGLVGGAGSQSGVAYTAEACGSVNQAAWLTQNDTIAPHTFATGEMPYFASSTEGYPANLQPALATALDNGVANAGSAWTVFQGRSTKPDYSTAPQWNIVPRYVNPMHQYIVNSMNLNQWKLWTTGTDGGFNASILARTRANFDGDGTAAGTGTWVGDSSGASFVSQSAGSSYPGGPGIGSAQGIWAYSSPVINTYNGDIVLHGGGHVDSQDGSLYGLNIFNGPGVTWSLKVPGAKLIGSDEPKPAGLALTQSTTQFVTATAASGTSGTNTLTFSGASGTVTNGWRVYAVGGGIPTGTTCTVSGTTCTLSNNLTSTITGQTLNFSGAFWPTTNKDGVSMPTAEHSYWSDVFRAGTDEFYFQGGWTELICCSQNAGSEFVYKPSQLTSDGIIGPITVAGGTGASTLHGYVGLGTAGGSVGGLASSDLDGNIYTYSINAGGAGHLWRISNPSSLTPTYTDLGTDSVGGMGFSYTNAVIFPDPKNGSSHRAFFGTRYSGGAVTNYGIWTNIDTATASFTYPTFTNAFPTMVGAGWPVFAWNSDSNVMAMTDGVDVWEFTITWNGSAFVTGVFNKLTTTGDTPTSTSQGTKGDAYHLPGFAYLGTPYHSYAMCTDMKCWLLRRQ